MKSLQIEAALAHLSILDEEAKESVIKALMADIHDEFAKRRIFTEAVSNGAGKIDEFCLMAGLRKALYNRMKNNSFEAILNEVVGFPNCGNCFYLPFSISYNDFEYDALDVIDKTLWDAASTFNEEQNWLIVTCTIKNGVIRYADDPHDGFIMDIATTAQNLLVALFGYGETFPSLLRPDEFVDDYGFLFYYNPN
jgi:hypothetical protein